MPISCPSSALQSAKPRSTPRPSSPQYVLITITYRHRYIRRATRMDGEDDGRAHWTCFQIARERMRLIWTRCRP